MNRRYAQVMIGLFLLAVGLNSLTSGEPAGVIMGLVGFYLLARQFEQRNDANNRRGRSSRRAESRDYERQTAPRREERSKPTTDRVYSHALEAVQRAGHDPSTMQLLPVDIGVFSYGLGADTPRLYRTQRLPKDIDYIQPFIELRVPRHARGSITFEVIDDMGETVFLRTETHELQRGRNLVVPARRLPVHDALDMDEGRWRLRVSADGVFLAEHDFGWREPAEAIVAAEHIAEDGELSNELRAAMAENRLEQLSLDELLAFQDDSAEPQRKQSASGS